MKNLEIKTKLPIEAAAQKLRDFFGPGGLGLEVKEDSGQCLSFEGGGGYVTANLCRDEKRTRIDLVTQEWEAQVDKFALKVK